MKTRDNKQLWRMAEWLYLFRISSLMDLNFIEHKPSFESQPEWYKNSIYDKAVILIKKIQGNEFTGEDDHED